MVILVGDSVTRVASATETRKARESLHTVHCVRRHWSGLVLCIERVSRFETKDQKTIVQIVNPFVSAIFV